jgi:PPOX class probable F420-dependent enzyme
VARHLARRTDARSALSAVRAVRAVRRTLAYHRVMPEPVTASPALAVPDEVLDFLRVPHRHAVVATLDPDGRARQVLVWYRLDGDTIVINSLVGRRWPTNLTRDPRISLTVSDGHAWVSVDGTIEVVEDQAAAQNDIATMARSYETPEEARASIARFEAQRRISFRVVPERTHIELED